MRLIPVLGAAALLCTASTLAYAQDTETPPTREEMGPRVSALAQGQRDAETKGIGATVREWARALGDVVDGDEGDEVEGDEVAAVDDVDGVDDVDEVDNADEVDGDEGPRTRPRPR